VSPGAGNVIAYSSRYGVLVGSDATTANVSVRGISIHDSGQFGINLADCTCGADITPNDPGDSDTGPNGFQNFPVIASATSSARGTSITGSINSTPNTRFAIDVYASDEANPQGNGEGAVFLGMTTAFTDAGGDAEVVGTFPMVAGNVVSATAVDPTGNTSEFSESVDVAGAGGVQFGDSVFDAHEGAAVTIHVVRVGGTDGAVSVGYATANGSAKAGADSTARSGTLAFADGQSSRTFTVPILNDTRREPAETLTVRLSSPAGGAAMGTPTLASVQISASD